LEFAPELQAIIFFKTPKRKIATFPAPQYFLTNKHKMACVSSRMRLLRVVYLTRSRAFVSSTPRFYPNPSSPSPPPTQPPPAKSSPVYAPGPEQIRGPLLDQKLREFEEEQRTNKKQNRQRKEFDAPDNGHEHAAAAFFQLSKQSVTGYGTKVARSSGSTPEPAGVQGGDKGG
jgi:hypothetical protein